MEPDLGPIGQIILGLATLINSLFLWPIVKKLQKNDEQQDLRLVKLEKKKRVRK